MGLLTKIIIGVIVFHLLLGFGYLVYKLSPKKGDQLLDSQDELLQKEEKP
jgi:hypothetical protein